MHILHFFFQIIDSYIFCIQNNILRIKFLKLSILTKFFVLKQKHGSYLEYCLNVAIRINYKYLRKYQRYDYKLYIWAIFRKYLPTLKPYNSVNNGPIFNLQKVLESWESGLSFSSLKLLAHLAVARQLPSARVCWPAQALANWIIYTGNVNASL